MFDVTMGQKLCKVDGMLTWLILLAYHSFFDQ